MATWYDRNRLDNTLTTSSPLHKLDALTKGHIKINGLHHWKYGMIMLLKHVDMMLKRNRTKRYKNDKMTSYNSFQQLTPTCTFATGINMSTCTLTWMQSTPSCRSWRTENVNIKIIIIRSTKTKIYHSQDAYMMLTCSSFQQLISLSSFAMKIKASR